jgi:MFS family permease
MRLFASRSFSAGSATNFLLSSALFGAVFFMAQFLQISLGNGPLASGLRLLPWTGCLFFVAPIAGSLVDRIGERPLIVLGLTLQAIGFGWIALIASTGLAYWEMVPPLMIAGAGISMSIPGAQNAVVSAVGADEIGKASGTFSMMRQLGGVFGVALAVAVFSGSGSYASPQAFASGFSPALWVSAAFSLAGALVAIAIPARRALRPTAVSEPPGVSIAGPAPTAVPAR